MSSEDEVVDPVVPAEKKFKPSEPASDSVAPTEQVSSDLAVAVVKTDPQANGVEEEPTTTQEEDHVTDRPPPAVETSNEKTRDEDPCNDETTTTTKKTREKKPTSEEAAALRKAKRSSYAKNAYRRRCTVANCPNEDVQTLHRFPSALVEVRGLWEQALGVKDEGQRIVVCNCHFLPTDYIPRYDRRLVTLKRIAVPSQNLPSQTKAATTRSAKKAALDKARQERLNKRQSTNSPAVIAEKKPKTTPAILTHKANADSEPPQPVIVVRKKRGSNAPKHPLAPLESPDRSNSIDQPKCGCERLSWLDKSRDSSGPKELHAAQVLLEVNQRVAQLTSELDLSYDSKDGILKVAEEFYASVRKSIKVSFVSLLKSDRDYFNYTGLSKEELEQLCEAVRVCDKDDYRGEWGVEERLVMCLVKIRLNLSFDALGCVFCRSEAECREVFCASLKCLKCVMSGVVYWPARGDVERLAPDKLESLKRTKYVVDRVGLQVDNSKCPQCSHWTAPEYFNRERMKVLLGFSHSGVITYVSKVQPVVASNRTITDKEYIAKVLVPRSDAALEGGFYYDEKCRQVFREYLRKRSCGGGEKTAAREKIARLDKEVARKLMIDDEAVDAYGAFKMFLMLGDKLAGELVQHVDAISVIVSGIVNLGNPVLRSLDFAGAVEP